MSREQKLAARMMAIAEDIFGTSDDPEQIQITPEAADKLDSISPHCVAYKLNEQGDPISWVVLIPTTKDLAESFLLGQINERELFDKTQPGQKYDAIYLCAAITIPEHRRQGLCTQLTLEALDNLDGRDKLLFSWPTTQEGIAALAKFEKTLGRPILRRQE